jgi:RND family efflux transporter MFP subunit
VVQGLTAGEFAFPGIVEAGRRLVMSFRVPGRLIELPVKEGEKVQKGQLIGRLDPTNFKIAVEEARAAFTKAEADLDRYRKLYEKDAVPIADLDLRVSQRDIAQARLADARSNLDYTNLRAPFSGQIGSRYMENFMDVQAQEPIADLNDISSVDIKIDASENLISPLKRFDKRVKIETYAEFDAAPGERFPMQFKEVSARADAATQTFEVTFTMPQPEQITLLPGMTAAVKLSILLAENAQLETQSTTIPAIAVLADDQSNTYVWVVEKDKMTVHKKNVQAAELKGSDQIVITEGLTGGEHIVVAGMMKLKEGMQVRLWEQQ